MTVNGDDVKILKELVSKYREQLLKNEAQVRYYLVNRILRRLGWDPEDPELVVPEEKTSEGFPDYVLMQPNGEGEKVKIMMIEVKKLSEALDSHFAQLGRYCYSEGTRYGMITNGSIYVLIKSFVEGLRTEQRVIWRTDLENDSISSIIRNLNTMDRNNIGELEVLVSKVNAIDESWEDLIGSPEVLAKAIVPILKERLSSSNKFDYEDSDLQLFVREKLESLLSQEEDKFEETLENFDSPIANSSHKALSKMYIGKEQYQISAANQILINTAEYLIRKGKITEKNLPFSAGPKRYLINIRNENKYGGPLPQAKQLSNGWWIMLNFDSIQCELQARKLLSAFGSDPSSLRVQ